jgi:predicted ribosomally synthesized peptide with SipW-like signal peptide
MTAQIQSSRSGVHDVSSRRRRRFLAFGLAGVVLAAGVAGAVVTSSAYFTDVKTISGNSVATHTIKLSVNDGTASALTTFALTPLAPLAAADLNAQAPTQIFRIVNSGTGGFNWVANMTNVAYTGASGTPVLTEATSPKLSVAKAALYYQIATTTAGVDTWQTAVLANTGGLMFTSTEAALTGLAPAGIDAMKIRFYLDPAADNTLQDLKMTFDMVVTATQAH